MEPSKRRVVRRSPHRTVWLLNLPHLQTDAIQAESSYERDFVYIAALYPYCRHIQHQPFRMNLPSGQYTPDFRVDFLDRSKAVTEIKPEAKLAAYAQTFSEASAILTEHQAPFLVVQEDTLHRNDRASRARQIRRYAKSAYSHAEASEILRQVGETSDGIEIGIMKRRGIHLQTILALLAHRQIQTTNELTIDDHARIKAVRPLKETRHANHFASWLDVEAR